MSYLFIAIIWVNHHYLMRFVGPPKLGLIWINFVHRFMVSREPAGSQQCTAGSFDLNSALLTYREMVGVFPAMANGLQSRCRKSHDLTWIRGDLDDKLIQSGDEE